MIASVPGRFTPEMCRDLFMVLIFYPHSHRKSADLGFFPLNQESSLCDGNKVLHVKRDVGHAVLWK